LALCRKKFADFNRQHDGVEMVRVGEMGGTHSLWCYRCII